MLVLRYAVWPEVLLCLVLVGPFLLLIGLGGCGQARSSWSYSLQLVKKNGRIGFDRVWPMNKNSPVLHNFSFFASETISKGAML